MLRVCVSSMLMGMNAGNWKRSVLAREVAASKKYWYWMCGMEGGSQHGAFCVVEMLWDENAADELGSFRLEAC